MPVKVGANKLCNCFWIIFLLLLHESDTQTAVVSLGSWGMKTEWVCLGGSSSHVWIKGTGSESLPDLLALGHFVSKGSLEFCVCSVVTKLLLTLNKGIRFQFFFLNMNQSFLSFGGIFHECKCIKIRLFSALLTFSASLKVQINVVSVLIAESVWLISWKNWGVFVF